MGGALQSAGGFLGLSNGAQAPGVSPGISNGTIGLGDLAGVYGDNQVGNAAQAALTGYGNGTQSLSQAMGSMSNNTAGNQQGMANAIATDPRTGTKFATDQVQNNGILGGLFGQGGQLDQAENQLTGLQNQGFNLQPQDQSLYGQEAGSIARQFGQQGNQVAQSLASRGLSNSGAAGATFSGLAGNQNEMLANAQQQIAQQRYQNTQQQIAHQQNFVSQLGQQGANDINQQYGRQQQGADASSNTLQNQISGGQASNQANMSLFNTNQSNKPLNIGDVATGVTANGTGMLAGQLMGGGGSQAGAQTGAGASTNYAGSYATGADGNSIASLGGAAAMYSDRALKADIEPAGNDIREMLDSLTPYSFRYSHSALPKGSQYGIMAQDLEKSKAGRTAVVERDLGKAVDTNKALSLILAAITDLHRRIAALEA